LNIGNLYFLINVCRWVGPQNYPQQYIFIWRQPPLVSCIHNLTLGRLTPTAKNRKWQSIGITHVVMYELVVWKLNSDFGGCSTLFEAKDLNAYLMWHLQYCVPWKIIFRKSGKLPKFWHAHIWLDLWRALSASDRWYLRYWVVLWSCHYLHYW